jgi:hypothetical protein
MRLLALLLALTVTLSRAAKLPGAAPGRYVIEVEHAEDIPTSERAAAPVRSPPIRPLGGPDG